MWIEGERERKVEGGGEENKKCSDFQDNKRDEKIANWRRRSKPLCIIQGEVPRGDTLLNKPVDKRVHWVEKKRWDRRKWHGGSPEDHRNKKCFSPFELLQKLASFYPLL